MINVRDYFKNKRAGREKKNRISYLEKIKSHKFMIFYRSILLFALVAAAVAVMLIQWKNKIYTQSVTISSIETGKPQNGNLVAFSEYILTYSKDGASCMDGKGNAVWNETFEMQNPMVDICRDVVAIGDYNGRSIYVMNTSGSLGEITTNRPSRNFCVAANGVVAVILDDSGLTYIYLFDKNGKELVRIRTTMKDSGYPFSISLSPNGRLLCVSYLFVDSGELKSSVAFYNFGEVGQNQTDNYVSGYDYLDVIDIPGFWMRERSSRFPTTESCFLKASRNRSVYRNACSTKTYRRFIMEKKMSDWYSTAWTATADTVWMCIIKRES